MTNSNDRLARIETLIERISQRVDSNAKAIEANSTAIAANREAQEITRASVDGLVQTIAEFSARSEARLNKLDDAIAGINDAITGINATNEQLGRILEQLVRRDRNGNGDQAQP